MKSRYLFNATTGSILVTPSEYVLEARSGSLRLTKPAAGAQGLYLLLILLVAFGFLGLFVIIAGSEPYQAARPWEDPPLLWSFLALFFVGFFGLLFATESLSRRLVLWRAARLSPSSDVITLRGLKPGKLIQKLLVQTADSRLLAVEVEATKTRFRAALDLAQVKLPLAPVSEEQAAAIETARLAAQREAPGPAGPGQFNVLGWAIVVLFGGFFATLYVGLLVVGDIFPGVLGLAIFGPLTAYMAFIAVHTRRFLCGLCGRITTFRRKGATWTCARCGGSWPRSPAALRAGAPR